MYEMLTIMAGDTFPVKPMLFIVGGAAIIAIIAAVIGAKNKKDE